MSTNPSRKPTCGTNPRSARKPSEKSLYSTPQSTVSVECAHQTSAPWPESVRPSHSAACSGRTGVSLREKRSWPVTVSAPVGLKRKSGPKTRLLPPPRISLSVTRNETNERPRSWRTRPTRSSEEKSWSARSEPFGPGRMTLPPPRSSATRAVQLVDPSLPRPAQAPARRGDRPGVDGRSPAWRGGRRPRGRTGASRGRRGRSAR